MLTAFSDHSKASGYFSLFVNIIEMSSATLKMGVENMVKHYFPEVKLVEGIDDPDSEVDPYY